MKKLLVVFLLLLSGLINGQEIYNFYLEPGASNEEAILHTSFYFNQGAGHIESNLDIVGNTINFSICYVLRVRHKAKLMMIKNF